MKRIFGLLALALVVGSQAASADLQINEIYFSPEDPKEDRQFFEIYSTTGATSLSNIWFLEIEGDLPIEGTQLDNPGQVLNAFNLSSFSTGSNGLFLWQSSNTVIDIDPLTPFVQGPEAASVVNRMAFPAGPQSAPGSQIFGYEEETPAEDLVYANDVHTFLLVEGFTGAVGDDLDSDDDGVLDAAWTTFIDGVSQGKDDDVLVGYQYAGQFGGTDVAVLGFGADVYQRRPRDGVWMFFDSNSGDGEPAGFEGPFFANDGSGPGDSDAGFEDGTEITVNPASTYLYATPGGANVQIPEPTTLLCGAFCGLLGLTRRRA